MAVLLESIDALRASVLRLTLNYKPLRKIFTQRSERLLFFSLVFFPFYFLLALVIPLYVIAFFPLALGVPHLFAGSRYLGQALKPDSAKTSPWTLLIAGLVFLVGLARTLPLGLISPLWSNDLEVASLIVLSLLVLAFYIRSLPAFLTQITLVGLTLMGMLTHPYLTLGVLAFGHNAVAFFFWWRSARDPREARISTLGFFLLCAGTLVILCMPQSILNSFALTANLPVRFELDLFKLAQEIFPSETNPHLAWKICCAYAFGQSVHYFVWLKAIPEQNISQKVPLSFRQSAKACLRELGPALTPLAIFATATFTLAIPFFKTEYLRSIYVSVASAHGYLELALIPAILFSTRRVKA